MVRGVQCANHPGLATVVAGRYVREKYSSARVSDVYLEPNNASPLNPDAANLWDSPDEFKAQLTKHYKPIAEDNA
jgi:hypothetical protein